MSPDWKNEIGDRFRVSYDKITNTFRILDLWDESVRNLPLDSEVPDNSPAIKIISILELNSLLSMLDKMGWLEKFKESSGTKVSLEQIPKGLYFKNND